MPSYRLQHRSLPCYAPATVAGLEAPKLAAEEKMIGCEGDIMGFFSDNSALYLYSAILQANAALLSVTAIFVIFKIQSLQSSIDVKKTALSSDFGDHTNPSEVNIFDDMTIKNKKDWIQNRRASQYLTTPHFETWLRELEQIENIKMIIVIPTALMGISIPYFALSLYFAIYIHFLSAILESAIMIISIIFESFCLIYIIRSIFTLLGIKREETFNSKKTLLKRCISKVFISKS